MISWLLGRQDCLVFEHWNYSNGQNRKWNYVSMVYYCPPIVSKASHSGYLNTRYSVKPCVCSKGYLGPQMKIRSIDFFSKVFGGDIPGQSEHFALGFWGLFGPRSWISQDIFWSWSGILRTIFGPGPGIYLHDSTKKKSRVCCSVSHAILLESIHL